MDYIRVHVIPTANDDGSNTIPEITKDDIRKSLNYANQVYKDADIFFVLDGFDPIRLSTLLNQDQLEVPKHDSLNASESPNKKDDENPCKAEKKKVSKEYPGKLVVFYGKGDQYYPGDYYVFSWNKVPGVHKDLLINFLTDKFSFLDWIKTAHIKKTENEIEFRNDPDSPYGSRSLRLHLHSDGYVDLYEGYSPLPDGLKVIGTLPDGKVIDRFFAEMENNELKIYQENWIFKPGKDNYSSSNGDYVRMIAAGSISSLAHEIGHYLHVRHVQGATSIWPQDLDLPSGSKDKSAETLIREYVDEGKHPKENGLDVFDGDRDDNWFDGIGDFLLEPAVADTPPNPGSDLFVAAGIDPCSNNKLRITVNLKDEKNRVYELVPDLNIMSYYSPCNGKYHHISRGQRDIIRDALDTGNRRHLVALSGLGVLSRNSHQLEVFYIGQDQALWHIWSDDSGDNWSKPESLGGKLTSAPAAISIKPDQLDIFYVGQNGHLYNKRNKAYVWLEEKGLGGNLASAPAVLSRNCRLPQAIATAPRARCGLRQTPCEEWDWCTSTSTTRRWPPRPW